MPVPRREPDRPPPVAAGSSTLSAVYGSLSAVTTLEFFEHPLRRSVIGYLLMTQLYPFTRLLLTPRTRKRPPQHGFVQVRLWEVCCRQMPSQPKVSTSRFRANFVWQTPDPQ